jgi:hypothetical protein
MSIFEDQQTTQDAGSDENVVDSNTTATHDANSLFADQLKSITAEDGRAKYNSVDDALKALKHSQEYIPQLKGKVDSYEAKIAQLEAELAKRSSVEEAVSRLTATESQTAQPAQGLDVQAVESLVSQVLSKREQQGVAQQNEKVVEQALAEKFGANAYAELRNKASELGMPVGDLRKLAQQSPKAFLAFFPDKTRDAQYNLSGINTAAIKPAEKSTVVARPEKSVLMGASSQEQAAEFRRHYEAVKAKLKIEG